MRTFSFLRRPWKLVLYGVLLVLLSAAGLILFLQYQLDAQALRESLQNYAYVGIISPDEGGQYLLKPTPAEGLELLRESDLVSDIQQVGTLAAKNTDGKIIPDYLMTTDQLQQCYYVQATVNFVISQQEFADRYFDSYALDIVKQWGADTIGGRGRPTISLLRMADEPGWEVGQQIFFVSNYQIDSNGVNTGSFMVYSPGVVSAYNMADAQGDPDPRILHPYLLLEPDEGEAEILDFMEETGIKPLYDMHTQLEGNIAVHQIESFSMLPYAAKGRFQLVYGRELVPEDAGKKVCMISQNLMLRNRYVLGDKVSLSIAQESYIAPDDSGIGGWRSGNPMRGEELITSYAPPEEYEIIGIYHQLSRDDTDPLFFGHNDIFIPGSGSEETVPSYMLSFRVNGPDHDAFQQQLLPLLQEKGCAVQLIDSGWEAVEETYYAMQTRRDLMLCSTITVLLAAIITFALLMLRHFRREFGLHRLLGAYKHEAIRVYFAAGVVIAAPALLIAALAAVRIFDSLMHQAEDFAQMSLQPLFLIAGGELLGIFLVLSAFVLVTQRRSILKLIG